MKFDAWLKKNDVDTFTKRDMPLTHLDKAILDDDAQPVKPTTYGVLLDEDMDLEAGEAPAGTRYAVGPYSELDHDDDDEEIDEETYQSITRHADPFLATPSTWSPMDSVAVSKIGWTDEAREAAAEARRRMGAKTESGKPIPDIDHAAYNDREKMPKYTGKVSPIGPVTARDSGKMLARRLPGWTKEDHAEAAQHHAAMAEYHNQKWAQMQHAAHMQTFGHAPSITDYKVSGVGRDEYSPEHKDALRYHAQTASMHAAAAQAHAAAAKTRGVPRR